MFKWMEIFGDTTDWKMIKAKKNRQNAPEKRRENEGKEKEKKRRKKEEKKRRGHWKGKNEEIKKGKEKKRRRKRRRKKKKWKRKEREKRKEKRREEKEEKKREQRNNIKVLAKKGKRTRDTDTNNKDIHLGYRNWIWHWKICNAYNEKGEKRISGRYIWQGN